MTVTKFMKIHEGDRFKKKRHQLNVTIFGRKFSKIFGGHLTLSNCDLLSDSKDK